MQRCILLCLLLTSIIFGGIACNTGLSSKVTPAITATPATPPTSFPTPLPRKIPTDGNFRLNSQIAERTASGKPLVIRVSYHDISNEFAPFIRRGVVRAVEDFGANVEMIGPVGPEAAVQIAELERLLEVGVDGLAISPVNSAELAPIINRYLEQGIPVVTFNADSEESDRLAFVGQDLEKAGYEAAKILAEHLKGQGDIIITTIDAQAPWSIAREIGARRALSEHPGLHLLDTVDTGTEPQDIYNSIEKAMRANETITGILSLDCCSTPVAGEYVKRHGLGTRVTIVGFDELPQTLNLINEGAVAASISQDPERQSYEAVRMLINFINGKTSKLENIDTGIAVIRANNTAEFASK